jgi:hypothetical protein
MGKLSMFMAPLKDRVTIWGTWATSISPGILVPSAEQKQSAVEVIIRLFPLPFRRKNFFGQV